MERVAGEVGLRLGIGEDWLNNAALQFFPYRPTGDIPTIYLVNGSVTIELASPETLLAMKLNAARVRDRSDIAFLLNHLGIESPEEATDVFHRFYPDKEFSEDASDRLIEYFGNS